MCDNTPFFCLLPSPDLMSTSIAAYAKFECGSETYYVLHLDVYLGFVGVDEEVVVVVVGDKQMDNKFARVYYDFVRKSWCLSAFSSLESVHLDRVLVEPGETAILKHG